MSIETSSQIVNGVNVTGFAEVIDQMKTDPSLGQCQFRARNRWQSGGHNRVEIQGFHAAGTEDTSRTVPFVHETDEPPVLMGRNIGANPVEFILSGLTGCMTTTLVYYAAMMNIELRAVESELEGDLDLQGLLNLNDSVRKGYQNIRVNFKIDSDAPREKLEELVEIARRFSPVHDIVTNPVPVTVTLED
ncbi:MAG: osmotically inducible protein C [Phycisphaerae bacterium]|nr:MAG: osmotically inducible protein C [Phycisphaerae bacterium]